ncbi:MAG: SAM-dependent methyltransferase [Burkholderiaceae bacterium]|jgi:16S rRNA (cytidine1402-2'-O)-methyltransferase|nr:SAM-dependent methyltransferase [Burkholderiaceae bacterium]
MSEQSQTRRPTGCLYLVPTPLDHGCDDQSAPLSQTLPAAAIATAARLEHWVCENAKSLRAFLKRVHAEAPLARPLQQIRIAQLPHAIHKKGDHAGRGGTAAAWDAQKLLAPALTGYAMGLVSEAGLPAVADPGSSVVRAAHALGIPVTPLAGPCSLILALAASGLNGQNFAFVGYLPQDAALLTRRLRDLEAMALSSGQTQLFIETPYRSQSLLATMLQTLQAQTRVSVSQALTLPEAATHSLTVQDWRLRASPQLGRAPAVFAIGV